MEKDIYRVGVKNRYELFSDDEAEDPEELVKQSVEKAKKKKEKKFESEDKQNVDQAIKSSGDWKDLGEKDVGASTKDSVTLKKEGTKKKAEPLKTGIEYDVVTDTVLPDTKDDEGFHEVKSSTRVSKSKAYVSRKLHFDTRGKREFDRQSGSDKSGVKAVEKRDGGGARNWGAVKDETEWSMEMIREPLFMDNPDFEEKSNEKERKMTSEPPAKEPLKMTLDEWQQIESSKRSVPLFNIRKPGEGEDATQWNQFHALEKKDKFVDEKVSVGGTPHKSKEKQYLDLEVKFSDMEIRRRAKGERERGVQGERRDPDAKTTSAAIPVQPAPKVDDINDFPSLSPT